MRDAVSVGLEWPRTVEPLDGLVKGCMRPGEGRRGGDRRVVEVGKRSIREPVAAISLHRMSQVCYSGSNLLLRRHNYRNHSVRIHQIPC
jgi:hypothetical protein